MSNTLLNNKSVIDPATVEKPWGMALATSRNAGRLVEVLKRAGISHEGVLRAIRQTPRHWFIDDALGSRAYENQALPIGFGQTISQPHIVALMTQTLIGDGPPLAKVLEIGTGSGYQTAILAPLVEQLYSVERISHLLEQARVRLRRLGINNVRIKHGDGYEGWERYAPYQGILVTAACTALPTALLEQLDRNGRLVAPVGPPNHQELVVVERRGSGFHHQRLGAVSFVPLLSGLG